MVEQIKIKKEENKTYIKFQVIPKYQIADKEEYLRSTKKAIIELKSEIEKFKQKLDLNRKGYNIYNCEDNPFVKIISYS